MHKHIGITVVSSVFFVSSVMAAGNGTINFTGAVNNQTCNVAVNGASGATAATITLPTVQSNILSEAGNIAG
ncbi:type 1 fimbrial protein, partial [Salmonella enterica subsp. enterica serovar Give]|nr:type 1 fimbrial protein [Salmonella enterica subsp. enterica serovar Give]